MITETIGGKEYLFVEVERASSEFWVDQGYLHYLWDYGESEQYVSIQLNENSLNIIGKANELTEEQWKGIVKMGGLKTFKDYTYVDKPYLDDVCLFNALMAMKFKTATESGMSLISSLNLKPETTLILQKQ